MHVFHIVRFMHSDCERERERAAEAICRGLLSVCRLGPSSHLVAEKRKNNNLTSIPFETPILRVQFLIVRIKSRDEIDLSSSSEEVHSLREDTSVELILYNINRHVRACCSQIPATLNTRFFFSLVAKNDRGKKSKGPVGFKWIKWEFKWNPFSRSLYLDPRIPYIIIHHVAHRMMYSNFNDSELFWRQIKWNEYFFFFSTHFSAQKWGNIFPDIKRKYRRIYM